jgi:hypothetical protein
MLIIEKKVDSLTCVIQMSCEIIFTATISVRGIRPVHIWQSKIPRKSKAFAIVVGSPDHRPPTLNLNASIWSHVNVGVVISLDHDREVGVIMLTMSTIVSSRYQGLVAKNLQWRYRSYYIFMCTYNCGRGIFRVWRFPLGKCHWKGTGKKRGERLEKMHCGSIESLNLFNDAEKWVFTWAVLLDVSLAGDLFLLL